MDPLKALGSFLLEKACERLKEEQEHYKQEDLAAQLENNVNGTEQLYGNDQKRMETVMISHPRQNDRKLNHKKIGIYWLQSNVTKT